MTYLSPILRHKMLLSTGLGCLLCVAPGSAMAAPEYGFSLSPRLEGNYRAGSERSIYQTEIWVPLKQGDKNVVYGDVRFSGDTHNNDEQNFGLGFRTQYKDAIYGVNSWIDRRKSQTGNVFYQGTVGAEYFSDTLDLRANAYLPITRERTINSGATITSAPFFLGSGLYVQSSGRQIEEAQPGFDLEIGTTIPAFTTEIDSIRVYAGGYHFNGDKTDNITGLRTRLTMDITPWAAIGARFQHDSVRGSQSFLEATLCFPGKASYRKDGLTARLDESPERDIDIVTAAQEASSAPVPIANTATGTQQRVIHVNNAATGAGDGSAEQPFTTLAAAQAAIQPHDIVYVYAGTGAMDGGLSLNQQGVRLIGSGVDFYYDPTYLSAPSGINSGVLIARATTAPVIKNTAGDGITIGASDISVSGVTVDGSLRDGIVIDANAQALSNITISNVTARNNRMGIYAHGYNNGSLSASIQRSTTTANTQHGIAVYDDTSGTFNVDLGGGTLGSIGQNGLYGNTLEDLAVDVDGGTLFAKNNWWGQASGADQDSPATGIKPQIYYGAPLNDGLTGHWTLDSEWTTNTTAYDRSGNNNSGTLNGGLTLANMVTGRYGEGLQFDGTNDVIQTTASVTDLGIGGASPKTAMVSINATAYRGVYDVGNHGNGEEFSLYFNGAQWRAQYYAIDLDYPGPINTPSLHTQVYNGTHATIYIDDAQITSQPRALNTLNAGDLSMGMWAGNYYVGVIDDMRVYNRALTLNEISEINRSNTSSVVDVGNALAAAP